MSTQNQKQRTGHYHNAHPPGSRVACPYAADLNMGWQPVLLLQKSPDFKQFRFNGRVIGIKDDLAVWLERRELVLWPDTRYLMGLTVSSSVKIVVKGEI